MPSLRQEVQQALDALALRLAAGARTGFAARVEAMEFLETHVLDRLQYLEEGAPLPADLQALETQAAELHRHLEEANERVLRWLRRQIVSGRSTPEGLKRAFTRCAGPPGQAGDYDTLDLFVAGLLGGQRAR